MNKSEFMLMDQSDPLAHKRQEFCLNEGQIYLDGNSLGVLPESAKQRAQEVIGVQWGRDLITSWNKHSWIDLPVEIGEKIAPLVGAEAGQVICCDSISVNIFKLLACALTLRPGRIKILSQTDNFPTDLYVAQGLQQILGDKRCEIVLADDGQITEMLDDSVAVLLLTQVNFRTGKIHNMDKLTQLAHEAGALIIWDLAHSAGAIPVELDNCNVDFAVGCGYKFLNGGPGAPAFVYAARKHHQYISQPLQGWMGHAKPFDFAPDYITAPGMFSFLVGTPPVVSMSILSAALDVFADADTQALRDKSIKLSSVFISLVEQNSKLTDFVLVSPRQVQERGSQVSFRHPQAYAICQSLIEVGVIADFRAPDILRFGITPLYTSFMDIWGAVERLTEVMDLQTYKQSKYQVKARVT